MKKVKLKVSGRVQGVAFRFMTKIAADKIGVFGIVRNEDDGSVYIEANGEANKIDEFIKQVKASPSPSGRVDQCDVIFDESIEDRHSFTVTY